MSGHIIPIRVYLNVFAALMVLLVFTVAVAYWELGILDDLIAMTIATAKAVLVILYFMHVRYGSRLTWLIAASGFFWLFILVLLTLSDFLTRDWLRIEGW